MNLPELPRKELVLQACRTEPRGDHPLLRGTHLLAGLHERRARGDSSTDEIESGRIKLIAAIDRWVAVELPVPRGGAHMHTETLGSVLDRLAQHCAAAHAALDSAPEWQVHDAWERLAELALGYQDLAADLTTGTRRLPGPFGTCAESDRPDPSTVDLERALRRYLRFRRVRANPGANGPSASIITLSA